MAKYARIINNTAVDVTTAPTEQFHPALASEFVSVPNAVQPGWIKAGNSWAPPAAEPAQVNPDAYPRLTPVQFKLLFTAPERLAIKAARATDALLDDAFDLLDDPRLAEVDLNLQSNRSLIAHLAENGLIHPDRVPQILTGALQ